MRPEPLPTGSRIGILGGGQLGRMIGLAARAILHRLEVEREDLALCALRRLLVEALAGLVAEPAVRHLRRADRRDALVAQDLARLVVGD